MKTSTRWKKFRIIDIFDVKNTKSILKEQIIMNSGNIPYVTAGENDNSVMTYVNCPEEWIEEGKCILIGGKTMVVTYQEQDFCSNDSHNLALHLKDSRYINRYIGLFMVTSIKKSLSHKYQWGDSISYKKIQNDVIELPYKTDYRPDWKLISNGGVLI